MSSWLILGAGLVAAAVLAASTLQVVTATLSDEVAYAAGVNEAASAPPSAATLRTALRGSLRMTPTDGETQVFSVDGMTGLMRKADGRTVMVAVDEEGYFHFTEIDESGNTERYVATINSEGRIRAVDPTAESSGLMSWHYEDREALNVDLPPTLQDAENGDAFPGWMDVDASQAQFHQDPNGPEIVKYVHPDGREVVYVKGTGEMVTDPRYAGSYNYVHMPPKPEEWTDIGGWVEWGIRGIGHTVADILPWAFDRLVTFVTGGDGDDDPPPPTGPAPGDDWPDGMGP